MGFFDNFNWGEAAMGFFADPEVTAARMKRRREEETAKRLRSALEGRGVPQADIELMMSAPGAASSYIGKMVEPKEPYIPDDEKKAKYYESIGDFDTAKDIRDRVGLVQTQKVDPVTLEVRTVYVRPGMLADDGSTGANLPRISTPAEAAKLPPGSPFIAPDGSRRRTPGGAGPSAPRTFPRPY